jgi:hypothetical protein
VGGQIINPQISKINIPKRKANLWKRGESIELFLCENSTVKTYCQFVLDVANNLFATGKTGNKKIAMERDRIKHKVAKYENSWTFEMRIPLTLIPNLNLKNATGIVCYNHDTLKMIYPYSSSWLVHKGFHWTKGYGPLNFLPVPNLEILKPDAVISLMNIKARNTVTAFGSGANVSFRINITSKKPLYSLTFNVKILDESGKELCKAMKIKPSREFIGPFFVSEKKHIQLPLEYKKIKIRIKAQFRTSDEKFHEKSFNQTIDVK